MWMARVCFPIKHHRVVLRLSFLHYALHLWFSINFLGSLLLRFIFALMRTLSKQNLHVEESQKILL
jgi:hypothetical protein